MRRKSSEPNLKTRKDRIDYMQIRYVFLPTHFFSLALDSIGGIFASLNDNI